MSILRKKLIICLAVLSALILGVYLGAERLLLSTIKNGIEETIGEDYAIIALHTEGKNHHRPSLWRMLRQAIWYELNINGEFTPQGSGGFTGKKHYLALLISDNEKIFFCDWSFRNWGINFESWKTRKDDIIKNLTQSDQILYSYKVSDTEIRNGLKYNPKILNDDRLRFYWRSTEEE